MNDRKLWALLVALAALALLVAGCGQGTPSTPDAGTDAAPQVEEATAEVPSPDEATAATKPEEAAEPGEDEMVTITWWGTERGRDTATTRELHFQLARAFEESHPNTQVAVSLFPSRGFGDRVLTAIAAGQGPDLFYHFFPTDIATQGFLEDLTPYIEAS
ncbi:MAG: extracellular solute-binding protein, partial [Ardenticatenaceae bacterium]